MILKIFDEVNCQFVGLPKSLSEILYKKYRILNPAMRFSPTVRLGRWDGKMSYFYKNGQTFVNLLEPMLQMIIDAGIEIEIQDNRHYNRFFQFDPIDASYVSNFTWKDGKTPIILREHQIAAINTMLKKQMGIVQLPTGSGKTLITAVLSKIVEKYGRSIVIVPNCDLIGQTEEYYKILHLDVGVFYGKRKEFFHKHTICTWQSLGILAKEPQDIGIDHPITFENYVNGVCAVIVDECQGLRGNVLKDLMTQNLSKVPIRWGLTGTVPKEEFEKINLTISLGEVIHELPTIDLQDEGILSNCHVHIRQLIDNVAFPSYPQEHAYLIEDEKRLTYVSSIIQRISQTGNVLVLVERKKTGFILENLLPGSVFVYGDVISEDRKKEYNSIQNTNNKILIATSALASVGLDIPRLNHLVFIEAGKSFIRTIQSIGRVLRTAFDKDYATIWDITSTCRYSKKHLSARKHFYNEQMFPFDVEKVMWEGR